MTGARGRCFKCGCRKGPAPKHAEISSGDWHNTPRHIELSCSIPSRRQRFPRMEMPAQMAKREDFDVCVIGTGAGGGLHRRVRGLSRPWRAVPLRHMEEVWLEDEGDRD